MCEGIKELLEEMIAQAASDDYEYGRKQTIGGGTGLYKTRSPWNTECEYSVINATASNPGSFLCTTNPAPNLPSIVGAASYGLASSGGESNYIDGIFVIMTTSDIYVPNTVWEPLPSPGDVYCLITATASQSLFVTLSFRRKLARFIPSPPIPASPHRPVMLREGRRTMMSGFEKGRYAAPGTQYNHPVFSVPEPSDPETLYGAEYGSASAKLAPVANTGNVKNGRRAYRVGRANG